MKKFYVLVDKRDLMFVQDEYNGTSNIDKAVQIEKLEDMVKYLATFDDDIIPRLMIYEVTEQITRDFKLIKENK